MSTDQAWKKWGETDPYFGVLSSDRFRSDNISSSLIEFFQTGEIHVKTLMSVIERRFPTVRKGRALDFGCGVGRLTIPLARTYDDVVGVDVSSAMLDEARINADNLGQRNIKFVEGNDEFSHIEGDFDLVNSYIVLQHIPTGRGMRIIRRLLSVVALNGVASIHVCLMERSIINRIKTAMRRYVPGLHPAINLYNGRPASEPLMEMNGYSLQKIIVMMKESGFGTALVNIETHGRFETASLIARRVQISP